MSGVRQKHPLAEVGLDSDDGRAGLDEEPMRGDLMRVERLEQLAATLAEAHTLGPRNRGVETLPSRLARNGERLTAMYHASSRAVREGAPISFAAEWILDNFHVIHDQLRECTEDLPMKYYLGLPTLADGDSSRVERSVVMRRRSRSLACSASRKARSFAARSCASAVSSAS